MQAKLFQHLRLGLVVIVLFLSKQGLNAQMVSQDFDSLLTGFREYHESLPVEKVFLHLDRTEYTQGETIWLKSYLLAGPGHLPSTMSKTIYVELLSEQAKVINKVILRSEEGMARASIPLGKNQQQGIYYIRAYTEWMKNHGPEHFFTRKIKVHSLNSTETFVDRSENPPLAIRFYPEGGQLVRHVASRVAFEVSGSVDDQKIYTGSIFNAKNKKVSSFSTSHEGRGLFSFVPKSGGGYFAMLEGSEERFPLPDINYSGVVMLINNQEKDHLNITVKNSKTNKDIYHLVAHTRGFITFASQIKLKANRTFTRIDKSKLPEGITHITLFDAQMRPLAERLAFINHHKELNIEIRPNKTTYGTRELLTVGLKVTDSRGKPVQGSFSLSAFDAQAENDQINHNIRTHLLLNSDLKGHIKEPSQYFAKTEIAEKRLDLLMMVKGWSRFDWGTLADYQTQELYPVETGLTVKGKLSRENGKDLKDGKVFLINNATKAVSTPLALTDEEGNFRFENQVFYDTTQLIFQGIHKKGLKNVNMEIDTILAPVPLNTSPSQNMNYNSASVDILKLRARTYVTTDSVFSRRNGFTDLGAVTVETTREGNRDGRFDGFLTTTDFTKIPFEEKKKKDPYRVMIGRIPGLRFASTIRNDGNSSIAFMEPRFGLSTRWTQPPTIFIDGVEATFQDVYTLETAAIDYVLTTKSPPPGLISIYTLDSERYNELTPKPGLFVKNLPGYHTPNEFYAPRYEDDNKNKDLPDQRTTLFWSPMITTDKKGEAMLNFYTPDQMTEVIVDVQGVSFNGNAGSGNTTFTIVENH